MERGGLPAGRIPQDKADNAHDDELVEIEPALDKHRAELLHYEFVIQTADGSHDRGKCHTENPFIFLEINLLLLARYAHHKYRQCCKQHSHPLIQIQSFSEYEHCSDQHQDRASGVDWADNRNRKMFQTEISCYP